MMKKITELTETRWRTIHLKDAYGNRERDTEEYVAQRPVKSVSTGPRVAHFIVDVCAFQILGYFVGYLFEMLISLNGLDVNFIVTLNLANNIVLLLLYPGLYIFCESKWQKSPGKFLTKTVVIDEYGNKPEFGTIILRSFIRLVPFEPISCLGDKYSYGWHDSWSKIWVVSEEELATIKQLQSEQSEIGA